MWMVEVVLGVGLVVVIAVLVAIIRRLMPAVRALPAPMPWERAFWCGASKRGGTRG